MKKHTFTIEYPDKTPSKFVVREPEYPELRKAIALVGNSEDPAAAGDYILITCLQINESDLDEKGNPIVLTDTRARVMANFQLLELLDLQGVTVKKN